MPHLHHPMSIDHTDVEKIKPNETTKKSTHHKKKEKSHHEIFPKDIIYVFPHFKEVATLSL